MKIDQKTVEQIKKLPKVELHRHLEGCISAELLPEIARDYQIKPPTRAIPVAKTPAPPARENFLTKYEMRTQEKGTCSFKVISNDAPNTIFILSNRITGQKTALLYVKRGDELEILVPPGEYGYQMIQGDVWLGDKEHFGLRTVYFDGDRTFLFEQNERGTSGHFVKLNTLNGNMKPVRTARIDLD